MFIRVVLIGEFKGVDLYNIFYVIGKERVLKRIKNIVKKYNIGI